MQSCNNQIELFCQGSQDPQLYIQFLFCRSITFMKLLSEPLRNGLLRGASKGPSLVFFGKDFEANSCSIS